MGIKVFVINLERSKERKKAMQNLMDSHAIPFEFIDAVDGTLLPDEFMEEVYKRTKWYQEDWGEGTKMKRGEVGVAMSHFKIYEKIIEENIDVAIVLEDDIEMDERFRSFFRDEQKLRKLMQPFDLLLLGYCSNDNNFRRPATCSYHGRINLGKVFRAGIPMNWNWSTIGYVVTNNGARLLAKKQEMIPCLTADILTGNSPQYGVKLGVIREQLVWPGELNNISTIPEKLEEFNFLSQQEQPVITNKASGFSFLSFFKKKMQQLKTFISTENKKMSTQLYPFKKERY